MKRTIIIIIAIVIAITTFILAGKRTLHAPPGTMQSPASQSGPTATINNHTFVLEIAKDDKTRERGLSYRTSLPQENGLLFLFDKPDKYSFWMKDMHFPIDIIYIKDDTVVHVFENVPPPSSKENLPIYTPDIPADKVLEINAGLSKKYNIKKGDTIELNL